MKVVYVKYRDPITWFKPDERYYEEDVDLFQLAVLRVAGALIREDEKQIVLGEISLSVDNPKAKKWGVEFPSYRYVIVIDKTNIVDRQDFDVKEEEL